MNRLLPNNAWDFFQRFHLSWRRLRSKCIQSTNIWLYWDSTETLLRLYWDSTEAAIGASSIPFPFHMAKVSPTNKGTAGYRRSFRHLCLAFSSLKTSSFSMSSARRASWDIIWSDCWHRLHLPWRNMEKRSKSDIVEEGGDDQTSSEIHRNSQISRNSIWNI